MSEYRPPYPSPPFDPNGPDYGMPRAEGAPPSGPADFFDEMAARIRANDPGDFAGAVVIVPPPSEDNPTEPIELLMIDPHRSEEAFWGVVEAHVKIQHGRWVQARGTPSPGSYR